MRLIQNKNMMLMLTQVHNVTGEGFSVAFEDCMHGLQVILRFLDALEKPADMIGEFFKIGLGIMK